MSICNKVSELEWYLCQKALLKEFLSKNAYEKYLSDLDRFHAEWEGLHEPKIVETENKSALAVYSPINAMLVLSPGAEMNLPHVLKMFMMIFTGSYRQNLREVINVMTALDQLKISVMNDKENQEKYNMERDRYQLMKYLKDLRKAKGITQKELAQKMGYSQQGISKLEHYNSNTTLDTFLGYCHYLGIDIFQLIQGIEQKKK